MHHRVDRLPGYKRNWRYRLARTAADNWQLYLLVLPAVAAIWIFKYLPLSGIQIAFREFRMGQPFDSGAWVGLRYFERFFNNFWAETVIRNTVILSAAVRIIEWPFPIILGLMLNNCQSIRIRKFSQTATYIPYLISVVVVVSLMQILLGRESGLVNLIIGRLGGQPVNFFGEEKWFFPVFVISELWQGIGFGAIIYLAALSAVDREMSEAALIDGATRLKKIWYIDLPAIAPTIITMLILRCGRMFQLGPDKILLMQTPLNLGASEIISTYVYKTGVLQMQYGFSTAIGLLNNAVNFLIMVTVNQVAKRYSDTAVF